MADFCAIICANESSVRIEDNHNRHVLVEDDFWWVLQLGERASSDLSILQHFANDPFNAPSAIGEDCAYVALRKSDQMLFVIRDPFGFIPVRYGRIDEGWIVWTGPEIPKQIHKRVNYERLVGFIAHRPDINLEDYYVGIKRILPGHCVRFSHREAVRYRYYCPDATYSTETLDVLCEQFRDALFGAIPKSARLLALSGGLDSSAILAGMSDNIETHTMFSSRFQSADERKEVATLSDFFGVTNTVFDVQQNKLWTTPEQFNDSNYEGYGPIFHPPVFGEQSFFSSMLKTENSPIVTGIGGDNALDVSPNLVARRYLQTKNISGLNRLRSRYPAVVKRQLVATPSRRLVHLLGRKDSIRDDFPWVNYPLKNARPFSEHWGESRRDRILSWSWEQVTRLLDSHGRSIGSPILSPWMSSAVWKVLIKVPPEMLFHGERHKGFLRHALKGRLPDEIRTAGKSKHFGKPTEYQFVEFQDEILNLFGQSSLHSKKLIEVDRFRAFFGNQMDDIHQNLDRDIPAPTMLVWPTIAAEIWLAKNSD